MKKKTEMIFAVAILFCLTVVLLSLLLGSVNINFVDMLSSLLAGGDGGSDWRIFLYVRLPRTLGSLFAGAALAVAGGIIQSVFSNPLASPSLIGVNSGAGLAMTLCSAFGLFGGWQMAAVSFAGAFLSAVIIAVGSEKWKASAGSVILAGVALNSLLNAISSAVVTLDPDVGVMTNDFKVGDFSSVTYRSLIPAAIIISVTLVFTFILSNQLDILTLGEENAKGLGMNVRGMRTVFLIAVALLAGSSVTVAGLLSFVGLIVPHAVRLFIGGRAKYLLPMSAILGGGFVTMCDLISRTAFSPYEVPVGIIMAFIGAPFFIFLLIKRKGARTNADG